MFSLEIKNLIKKYPSTGAQGKSGGKVAVDNISFEVKKGEFFGFLGPNGAGKTSTINSITGIGKFDSGEIKVCGHDVISDYREARKCIGLSPQELSFDYFITVKQTLDYAGGYFGMRKREREKRIDYLLDILGMKEYGDKKIQELSGGYKRRVSLARSMIHDPQILILDEPTAGVDVELRRELWKILENLNKEGKTIFLTTHYLEEAQKLCQRIGIIFSGKIVSLESKDELIKDGQSIEDHYLKFADLAKQNSH